MHSGMSTAPRGPEQMFATRWRGTVNALHAAIVEPVPQPTDFNSRLIMKKLFAAAIASAFAVGAFAADAPAATTKEATPAASAASAPVKHAHKKQHAKPAAEKTDAATPATPAASK